MLGSAGVSLRLLELIVLPITVGDTPTVSPENYDIRMLSMVDTTKKRNNLILALMIFAVVAAFLFMQKPIQAF